MMPMWERDVVQYMYIKSIRTLGMHVCCMKGGLSILEIQFVKHMNSLQLSNCLFKVILNVWLIKQVLVIDIHVT